MAGFLHDTHLKSLKVELLMKIESNGTRSPVVKPLGNLF